MIVTFRNKGVVRGHSLDSIVKLRFGRSARIHEYESQDGYTVRTVVKQTPNGLTAVLDEVTSITREAPRTRYDLTPGQLAAVYGMS